MSWRNVVEISNGVYWVGSRDWNRRLFDALIPLPDGTTYNAYLVIGREKKALIDTVNPGFERELEEKLRKTVDPGEIDYLVMNHAEPDHAGAIPHMMALSKKAKLVATSKGARMAEKFYGVPKERIISVPDQGSIDLGGKTLRFIEAPMLHWPETMFTYLPENKVLFPCDFFGSHVARSLYDSEVEDLIQHAKGYFGEIMMPYRALAVKGIEKIKGLPIEMIAPSHGPIYRDPARIVEPYRRWAAGETEEKAVAVYVTMWRSTEKMIRILVDILAGEGVEVALYDLTATDLGSLARDLVDARAIVLGTPTVLGGAHPLALYAAHLTKALNPPAKLGVVVSSYGWGGVAIKSVAEILGSKLEVVGTAETFGPPHEEDVKKLVELGKKLAARIKEKA